MADFAMPNGWASDALGKKRVTFADLESKGQLDHFRPYYKMASHNVHAGAKGITWRLGLLIRSGKACYCRDVATPIWKHRATLRRYRSVN